MQQKDRKPWHGSAGAPKGRTRTLERFIDEIWTVRPAVVRAHSRRTLTKTALAKRVSLSRSIFTSYCADMGAPWPLPPDDHLVYVVDRTGTVRWASPSLCAALHCTSDELVGWNVADAVRGGQNLKQVMPEVFAMGEQLIECTDGLVEHYSMYLVRHDDGAHVFADLSITYGRGFEVFFIDAVLTGRIELAEPEHIQMPLKAEDLGEDLLNVDQSVVYTVTRGQGKTQAFLARLGYHS